MKKVLISLVLCLLLIPVGAMADVIDYNGIQQPGLKVEGYLGHSKIKVNTVGEFNVTWDEKEVLVAYCANILDHGVGGVYDVQALSDFDYTLNNNLYRAAWIMENYTTALGYSGDSQVAVTAVQAAIWNLLPSRYDPWVLTKVKSGSHAQKQDALDLYASILGESAGIDFSTYQFQHDFYWGDSQDNNQDLLFATTPSGGVPEPATLLLVGSALSGFWGFRRRRRKATS